MSQLATLRSRLNSLRQRRATMRWGNAWSAFGTALMWLLILAFLVDFWLEMNRPQRFLSLLCIAGALWWTFSRFTKPFLGHRETELDIALLVEKQQEIDTDLVAALQFESPAAKTWGSATLERAVIDYVADFGKSINVFKGFDTRQLKRRLGALAVTSLLVGLAIGLFPNHASAFFNRLLLGSKHYPTRTVIEKILVNGQEVKPDASSASIKMPFGKPLRIQVTCSGELPVEGLARLTSIAQGATTTLKLTSKSSTETKTQLSAKTQPSAGTQSYDGEHPRLVDSLNYQLYLGDAWTDPVTLKVIPLPVVTVDLSAMAPSYAAKSEQANEKSGSRQIAVLEGSRVELKVTCSNKPLASVQLTVDKVPVPMLAMDEGKRIWQLPENGHPFQRVTAPIRYSIQVEDEDNLSLEQPITGFVRLKGDRPPRVIAGIISKRILPGAKPKISFGASDDYGLGQIRLIEEVVRESGETTRTEVDVETIPPEQQPKTTYRGQYTADLKKLKLVKGDQLRLIVEAIDFRGEGAGKSATSEPLVLEVTDVQGFLAGMAETDEQSARRLDAIIQRQLGIGETK